MAVAIRSLVNMDEQFAGISPDIAERGLRYTKDQVEEVLQQTGDYVRQNPTQAVGFALLAGFILNRLPLGRILGGLVRLIFVAAKPAIIAYGATKLYQAAQTEDL